MDGKKRIYKIGKQSYNHFGGHLGERLPKPAPVPLPSPREVDLYYRGLPGDISPEQLDIIIAEENDYADYL